MTSSRPHKWHFIREDVPAWGLATLFLIIAACIMMLGIGLTYATLEAQVGDFTGWQPIFFIVMTAAFIVSMAGVSIWVRAALIRRKERKEHRGTHA